MPTWINLECGHQAYTEVTLRNQYVTDSHYVWCPPCRKLKEDGYDVATAWIKVVDTEDVSNVPSGTTLVMPNEIMRVQPSVPLNRTKPFPYVKRIRR